MVKRGIDVAIEWCHATRAEVRHQGNKRRAARVGEDEVIAREPRRPDVSRPIAPLEATGFREPCQSHGRVEIVEDSQWTRGIEQEAFGPERIRAIGCDDGDIGFADLSGRPALHRLPIRKDDEFGSVESVKVAVLPVERRVPFEEDDVVTAAASAFRSPRQSVA